MAWINEYFSDYLNWMRPEEEVLDRGRREDEIGEGEPDAWDMRHLQDWVGKSFMAGRWGLWWNWHGMGLGEHIERCLSRLQFERFSCFSIAVLPLLVRASHTDFRFLDRRISPVSLVFKSRYALSPCLALIMQDSTNDMHSHNESSQFPNSLMSLEGFAGAR